MFFLPFLYEKYPAMRLVHVLRDGRDVAFSKQQRARFQEGVILFPRSPPPHGPIAFEDPGRLTH